MVLKELVDKTQTKIVLTYSWKESWYKEQRMKDCQDELTNYPDRKLRCQRLYILDKIAEGHRAEEIQKYVATHPIEAFVILDDEDADYQKYCLDKVNPYNLQEHEYKIPKLRCIKDCAREWNKHRKTGDRFIHADEIRDFLKTDTTVFKYKFDNKWIVNYDQLLPHLKKINRRESKMWKKYMARIGIKKSVTPRKK